MTRRATSTTCAAVLAAASLAVATSPTVTLTVPGRASANLSIAAVGEAVAVVWGARTESGSTDIYAAVSRDAGITFGAPVRVSGSRTDAQVSGEQPPRVALVPQEGGRFSIVAVWTAKGATGTRLLTARSDDQGRSFGGVTIVPGSDAPGNRGWEAISTQADGRVAAIWLDHRDTARAGPAPAAMHHDEASHAAHMRTSPTDGAARAQWSKLYFGRVDGAESPRFLAAGVCYCCKTTLATGGDGALYAAWRHVYPGNVRDIAFTVSRDGGRSFATPVRVSDDRWVLDGCPENGPTIAVGSGGRIHVAWPTLVAGSTPDSDPTLALFHATSADGQRFTTRQRLTTEGTPYHPQMAIGRADGSVLIVWDELRGGRRHVIAARGEGPADAMRFVRQELAAAASYPAVAPAGRGFVVGWTDTSRPLSRIVLQSFP